MHNDESTALEQTPDTVKEGSKPKSKKGFAALSKEEVRKISSMGGKAAHAKGTAHCFSSEEAKAAGRKGGSAPHKTRGKHPVAEKDEAASAPSQDPTKP